MTEKKHINCPIKHIGAYIVKHDNGNFEVKCANIKVCGDSCPYLKDPDYIRSFKRAPEYVPK